MFTRQFLLDVLQSLNYDIEGVDDRTSLGPDGLDLESLSLAEVLMRIEEHFGVHIDEEETERLAGMTVGEFTATLARLTPAKP
ncbi:acyl carrier protein [Streptomyces sp. NPDC002285]